MIKEDINSNSNCNPIVEKSYVINTCSTLKLIKGYVKSPSGSPYPFAALEIIEYNSKDDVYKHLGITVTNELGAYGLLLDINPNNIYTFNVYSSLGPLE
ncbi:hypothetical protein [Oceanirhabdus sp. W0125-5]|uniref:hypothetical protein n=1 Tax=Oceanirhabdus sp. W0125-5 TaxID=2999116 RepID=UPI0022F2AE87|nr:hypothetical protein [Oceanirhabdus sp. W0125-5]WBW96215.1 hypothetical protein OW730_21360 [Oceanirhabdus sp. W0125-5]